MAVKIEIGETEIKRYEARLKGEEKSAATVEKYIRNIKKYSKWLNGREATKENAIEWKESIIKSGYASETVNACLAAVNKLFAYNRKHWKIKYLHVQRKIYRDDSKDLNKDEYARIIKELKKDKRKERTELITETICSTGIRASELKYITREAAERREAVISMKGKTRTVLLPEEISRKLIEYAEKKGIKEGVIFKTRSGKAIDRRQVWQELKRAGKRADVAESKIYPHNLRHLFARTFYEISKDIVKLSDVLGHTSINTTRIYLISTGSEHRRILEQMGLAL